MVLVAHREAKFADLEVPLAEQEDVAGRDVDPGDTARVHVREALSELPRQRQLVPRAGRARRVGVEVVAQVDAPRRALQAQGPGAGLGAGALQDGDFEAEVVQDAVVLAQGLVDGGLGAHHLVGFVRGLHRPQGLLALVPDRPAFQDGGRVFGAPGGSPRCRQRTRHYWPCAQDTGCSLVRATGACWKWIGSRVAHVGIF